MAKRLLLIEDNPSDALIARHILENKEYLIDVVDDGHLALEKLDQDYALIILDLQLPKIPGVEVLKRIRRTKKHEKTPILIMSARNQASDIRTVLNNGASDYIIKPIDAQILESKVALLAQQVQESWAEINVAEASNESSASYQQEIKITTISEVSLKMLTSFPLEKDRMIRIDSQLLHNIDVGTVVARVVDCRPIDKHFEARLMFVGLKESEQMKIRLYCRKHWAKENEKNL